MLIGALFRQDKRTPLSQVRFQFYMDTIPDLQGNAGSALVRASNRQAAPSGWFLPDSHLPPDNRSAFWFPLSVGLLFAHFFLFSFCNFPLLFLQLALHIPCKNQQCTYYKSDCLNPNIAY